MDTIKDFFAELKERASNPLIVSFMISWLLVNWPITIGLLFYKQEELQLDGISSYYDLVRSYSNFCYTLLIPLGFALFYTFVFPFIKAWIKLLNAWVSSKNESDILIATKAGMMPVLKYIELKSAQEELTQKLNHLMETQSSIHNKNAELEVKLAEEGVKFNELSASKIALQQTIDRLTSVSNASLMDGTWIYTSLAQDGTSLKQIWEFNAYKMSIDGVEDYHLKLLVANSLTATIAFRVVGTYDAIDKDFTFWFSFNDNFTELTSKTNPDTKLTKEIKVQHVLPHHSP